MKYNFDKIISRQNTNAISVDGFKEYIFDKTEELVLPYPKQELISMWVADMEFSTAPEIISALEKRVKHGIFGYTQIFDDKYKASFINWALSKYNWAVNENHLVISNGVVTSLYDLIPYFCKKDEKLLILTPAYAYFKHAADYNKIELVTSKLICKEGKYQIDFEDLVSKLKDPKVTLFLFCSPHNPTGRIWTTDELKQLGDLCFENDVSILSDEIHCDILRKGFSFTPLAKLFPESNQIVTCMSASKTFNLQG